MSPPALSLSGDPESLSQTHIQTPHPQPSLGHYGVLDIETEWDRFWSVEAESRLKTTDSPNSHFILVIMKAWRASNDRPKSLLVGKINSNLRSGKYSISFGHFKSLGILSELGYGDVFAMKGESGIWVHRSCFCMCTWWERGDVDFLSMSYKVSV